MKLFDLAAQTGAECALSDGDIEISGAAGLDQARSGEVTFLSNPKYTNKIATTRAAAIYVAEDLEILRPDMAILRAKDPYLAFTRALIVFHPQPSFEAGIDPAAHPASPLRQLDLVSGLAPGHQPSGGCRQRAAHKGVHWASAQRRATVPHR